MPQRNQQYGLRSLLFAVLALSAWTLVAQQTPTLPAASSSANSSPIAETQPSLTVDRDPVASPDDILPSASPTSPSPGAAPAAAPGQAASSKENGRYLFRTSVEEVVLNVTVVNAQQHLVTTLTGPDFTVYEDNVQQKITSFHHEDIPVSLGILIDNSGSMRDKRAAVNRAALDLVRASNPQDEAFIVNFSDDAFLDQDFTSSVPLLQKGLSHIDSKGGTALYDAVVASADHLAKDAKRPKQVLLIITDGEDNSSSTTLEQTVRRIQDLQGPIVYSIGLLYGDDEGHEAKRARRALELLSNETGGLAYFPKSLAQVDEIADEVAQDIRNQYTIGYHPIKPATQAGAYRTVRVVVKAKGMGKLIARTRPGYYPGPEKTSASSGLAAGASKASTSH
jgi:VWFA-related protein